ncbi:hypothetical protein OsJ_23595 [Oryza sativa Japonica Group]|uniref:GH18 domain-containing protein n=1 Tax=Oryza sativa subsp. japonica TaxID=39947 RepID=B9FW90_ORYSJ|nr:hypothetical protein OsJ_23595 [Oryza sativa Japonica Group]
MGLPVRRGCPVRPPATRSETQSPEGGVGASSPARIHSVSPFSRVFGHGRYWADLSGHPVASVGADIKHYQHAKNVTVLLSIGGEGDQYSLPMPRSAKNVADHLWDAYLGGHRHGLFHPFGDAE